MLDNRVFLLKGCLGAVKDPCSSIDMGFKIMIGQMDREAGVFPEELREEVEQNLALCHFTFNVFEDVFLCEKIESKDLELRPTQVSALDLMLTVSKDFQSLQQKRIELSQGEDKERVALNELGTV
jgi:hypothetical protein